VRESATDALHDAMEGQSIHLAKAEVLATLPTRTSVFMSTNPRYGQFDRYEPPADQIAISPSLVLPGPEKSRSQFKEINLNQIQAGRGLYKAC
jgi:hypothetical protein